MRRTEQTIFVVLVVVGMVVAFWLLVLSPKRQEASELEESVSQLRTSLSEAQAEAQEGREARRSFRVDYRRLVVLGKAVPAGDEQSSLLVQLQGLADRAGIEFQGIGLQEAAAGEPPPTTSTSATADTGNEDTSSDSTSPTPEESGDASSSDVPVASEPAPASEPFVAALPIGASVGPAGLPVMPYELTFTGDFTEIADFMASLDRLVGMKDGLVDVRGRLLTVDGFTLTPTELASSPELEAKLSVTSFLTPSDQGLTGGATPAGPPPADTTLASDSESATEATPTPTASVTP